ncbi:uncharacterized protein isoform X2 [Danio rerio]|uniref:Uncharacterized protein isoform X2 n=1 Tax=Danio rerio TaxID=7955 RepID=A0AC58IG77_DANRE
MLRSLGAQRHITSGSVVKMIHVFNLLSWLLILRVLGVTGTDVPVSVMEEDSVILHTGVENLTEIKWYFNKTRIAQLNGNVSFICTDNQCINGTERFRGRLKLDLKTGSLTIMKINKTHSGEYQLVVDGIGNSNGGKILIITVQDNPAVYNQVKKNPGESVTFNPGVRRDIIVVMKCFLNNILIAEITGGQSQICSNVQCKERFTDRLKLDSETASLTITNIRNTDSGNYTLEIFIRNDTHFSITREKTFSLTVVSPPPSRLSGGAIAGIVILLVVVAAVVGGVIYYLRHRSDRAAQPEGVADDPSSHPLRDMGDS